MESKNNSSSDFKRGAMHTFYVSWLDKGYGGYHFVQFTNKIYIDRNGRRAHNDIPLPGRTQNIKWELTLVSYLIGNRH